MSSRNPVAAIIEAVAPKRDTNKEERLRKTAMWASINDGIAAIGKSIANAGGVRTSPLQPNRPLYSSIGELGRLDDIYRQEGYRYDGLRLSDALRNKQQDDAIVVNDLAQSQAVAMRAQQRADDYKNLELQEQMGREREDREYAHRKEEQNRARIQAAGISASTRKGDQQQKPLYHIPFEGHRVPIYDSDQVALLQSTDGSVADFAAKTPIEQQSEIAKLYAQRAKELKRIDDVRQVIKSQNANTITHSEAVALFPQYKDRPKELAKVMSELGLTITIQ